MSVAKDLLSSLLWRTFYLNRILLGAAASYYDSREMSTQEAEAQGRLVYVRVPAATGGKVCVEANLGID